MARVAALVLLAIVGLASAQFGYGRGYGYGHGLGYGHGMGYGHGLGYGYGLAGYGGYYGLGHHGYHGHHGHHGGHLYHAVPQYAYNYAVRDFHTGDNKQASEHRHGDHTVNQYSSALVHHG